MARSKNIGEYSGDAIPVVPGTEHHLFGQPGQYCPVPGTAQRDQTPVQLQILLEYSLLTLCSRKMGIILLTYLLHRTVYSPTCGLEIAPALFL